jgi:hypothetical protein
MTGKSGLKWMLASLLVAGSGAALAHEPEPGKEHKRKIVILDEQRVVDGKEVKVEGHGAAMVIADCSGARILFSDSGEEKTADGKGKKTRIMICSRGEGSAEERAKKLEHALARINAHGELSPETRTRITTALREAITRLNTVH